MQECDCPAAFRSLARSFWGVSGAFPALRQVLREDDEDMLARTLYRQLVLWFRPDFPRGLVDSPVEVGERGDGKLWTRISSILTRSTLRNKAEKAIRLCVGGVYGGGGKRKFEKDQKRFSWLWGDHPMLVRARERCRRMPGLEEVLMDLVRFDWKRQMSYEVGD